MPCCIAIAYLFGLARRLILSLLPVREQVELPFAPPARRPAPLAETTLADAPLAEVAYS